MKLTDNQVATLIHGLRVAAERFTADAGEVKDVPRIAEQFKRQARESRELADALEDAGAIELHDQG